MELRCGSKILHGVTDDDGTIEVACKSKWCGKKPGVVVLHKFSIKTGECVSTTRLREPEEGSNGDLEQGSALRHAAGGTDTSRC